MQLCEKQRTIGVALVTDRVSGCYNWSQYNVYLFIPKYCSVLQLAVMSPPVGCV